MTTITIKNGIDLPQTQFDNISELIDVYFAERGKIILEEINPSELPKQVQEDLEYSKTLGKDELYNFQG